jgi:hypothetical protein
LEQQKRQQKVKDWQLLVFSSASLWIRQFHHVITFYFLMQSATLQELAANFLFENAMQED